MYIQQQLRANEIQSSTTHAFPRTSFPGFQRHIEETNFPATTKTKIENLLVKAYSLCHEDVLRELKTIATSDVNSGTLFYDDDHITPWHPGMYLKYYWKSWCNTFPALADSLEHNFGSMFSTTTVLEQSFSTYNSKADANATGVSNCAIIRHHINSTMELTKETVEDAALILTGDSLAGICITQ